MTSNQAGNRTGRKRAHALLVAVVGGDGAVLYAGMLPASARSVAGVAAPTAAMVGRAVAAGVPGLVWGADAVLPLYGRAPDAARWVGKGA